ncbi:hypothetical protein GC167_09130 [bacterium]|nr:hypothetical protein [bacterium]
MHPSPKSVIQRLFRFVFGVGFLIGWTQGTAQTPLRLAIVSDAAQQENHLLEEAIKTEVRTLLSSRYRLEFTERYTHADTAIIRSAIAEVYADQNVDVLIGVGVLTGDIIARQRKHPKPTLSSIQLLGVERNTTAPDQTGSGMYNYTYIQSPFYVQAGLKALSEICRCSKLVVLTPPNLAALHLEDQFPPAPSGTEVRWIELKASLAQTAQEIPSDAEGIYILSALNPYSPEEIRTFFSTLTDRKLPTFSLLDVPMLGYGAYAAFSIEENLRKIPRRIALNVERIAGGENAMHLPVQIESFSNQLIINMQTVNKTGLYPNWTVLDNALLVNINQPNSSNVLSLKSAIALGIQNNLGYKIEAKQTEISDKEVDLARSNYLPRLDVESNGFFLDQNTVNSAFGTVGTFNWTAGATFSQLIVSEPAMANIAIQKLLYESQAQAQKQSELDVILEVSQRYFNYLQVLAVADLQNNNVKAVHHNLQIAKNKESVGYNGASDVHRWQTELDLAKTELYTTNAQLKAVRYQLNEALNRPIDEVFVIDSTERFDRFVGSLNEVLTGMIQNQGNFEVFSDFMVSESRRNLPELQQIQWAISAQERLLRSNKRSFYLPTVGFGANYDYPVLTVDPSEPPPLPGIEIGNLPSWNAGFNVSIPILAGGSRIAEQQRTKLGLQQLQVQEAELNNLLELQVRSNLELVNASYNNIRLTKSAAEAAEKNIAIVQDLYETGQVDVITLVDAQNALLGAQLNATNASFEFMIDFFALQRSIGQFTYLGTETQRAEFLQRFMEFKTK